MNKLLGISLCLGLLACAPESDEPSEFADLIFVGNNIITMDESNIEAVAVVGDRIAATGTADDILVSRGPDTRVVELGEKSGQQIRTVRRSPAHRPAETISGVCCFS